MRGLPTFQTKEVKSTKTAGITAHNGYFCDDLRLGDCVSMDQYKSSVPDHLSNTKGKEPKKDRYNEGIILVDHVLSPVFVNNQIFLNIGETLWGKEHTGRLQNPGCDNQIVPCWQSLAELKSNIETSGQSINYYGIGTHHQNGVAKKDIKIKSGLVRSMLLHAILYWTNQANLEPWPFVVKLAAYMWNHMPHSEIQIASSKIFSSTVFLDYNIIQNLHVWGCSCYILEPTPQNGWQMPRWQPRTIRGKYIQVSTSHFQTVSQILNIHTGSVSLQNHAVFDNGFSTVPSTGSGGVIKTVSFSEQEWRKFVKPGLKIFINIVGVDPFTVSKMNGWQV